MSDDDDDLASEIHRLRSEVDALQRRVAELESTVDDDVTPTTDETPHDTLESDADTDERQTDDSPPEDPTPARERPQQASGRDWERDLGSKWLGVVGGLALVAGVVFFIQLAIEAGLLGHLARVAIGAIGGLALFGSGRFAAQRQGYVRWGRITGGVGLAIAYFSVYAAYGFETYREAIGTPLWAVLGCLTLLVAGAAVVTVRDGAPIVASEAFTFGYVTAFLALESGSFLLTPAYVLLLAGGLVAIAAMRPWYRQIVASVGPTYVLVHLWNVTGEADPGSGLVVGTLVVTFGIYLVGSGVLRSSAIPVGSPDSDTAVETDGVDRWRSLWLRTLTVLNAGLAAIFLEFAVRNWVPDLPVEGVAVGAIALALAGVYAITGRQPVRRDETAGAFAVVLFGTSVVLAFGPFAATVGLLAIVCGAIVVATSVDAGGVRIGGHLVAVGIVPKLLLEDATALPAFDLAEPLASATGRGVAFALTIGTFYGLARWFQRRKATLPGTDREVLVAAPYAAAATGLTVVLLGLELSGAGISVAWAVFGLVLVAGGLAADTRGLRLQGVAVLGLVTAKVFLFDTQDLAPLARTTAFLVLGAILLVASYGYARWQGEDPIGRFASE